ncbi:MAG: GPR1/FUN34/YaaH family transporter [Methanomassiliicoccaceae archaeon]|jgi:succinate-acetate transporter protein|nr:GPR1/FUN34/YaaH family transporter [Methanomassiliicoccaceae archaeon]
MEGIKEIKVQTKEWANPTPAGLVALAVAAFCFFAMLDGRLGTNPSGAMMLIGCWLIGGFVVQVIVGVLDLKSSNNTGGNTFLFFSAFFMLASGLSMFVKAASASPIDTFLDGYVWLAITMVLFLWTPAFFKPFGLLTVLVLLLDIALPVLALMDLHILDATFRPVAAYALLAAGIVAIYLCSALVVNKAFGKTVYPLLQWKKK